MSGREWLDGSVEWTTLVEGCSSNVVAVHDSAVVAARPSVHLW